MQVAADGFPYSVTDTDCMDVQKVSSNANLGGTAGVILVPYKG